ncbi:outer membrane protein [Methylosinus sp. Sm6]|uniref:outer membrane protein n=1 Tax=Methylosinus sp. Sm6 TaxID=2866948 RepID=UPI001C9A0235|nr:outer membrane beta-barrel protein [Methylosinus sp. Sm6]MBY6240927.1 outer membrane beta-barrel protein [Methylosinus sp. Sm6]
MNMKFSALAVAAALVAGPAAAADLPSRKEAPVFVPPPVFSWTGPYIGLNLGGSWLTRNNDRNNWGWGWNNWNNNNGSNAGVSGGLQIGYNYQLSPMFVVGLETDIQGTSIGGNNNNNNWWGWGAGWWNNGFDRERVPWFGTVRGRLGVALLDSRLLIYGTGGFGYGEVNRSTLLNWWGNNNNGQIRTGWTAGGGLEWAFLPNWSAKIEYLYTELENNNNNNDAWLLATLPVTPGVVGVGAWGGNWWNNRRRTQINTVRAGVNYHFNLFTPAPVIARY